MKNILLLVHDDQGQEARLQVALDLTRAFGGHLSCLDVTILPALVGDYYGGATGGAMLLAEESDRETRNKAAIEARLAHEDVSWDWQDVTGDVASSVIDAASLADLIVLNRRLDDASYPDMRAIASRIVMHARKPVVAVPETRKHFAFNRAMIAWDGKASCAATLRASIPLLALADTVEIFMVRDGSEQTGAEEAAKYLSRHDIRASIHVIDDVSQPADQLIADECTAWRADYVVMGAYNHGRMMEAFGGVTKRLLASAKVPLVLGH